MTCRENRGSSAWTSYVRAVTGGITDQQMLSSFHELQREGVDYSAPSAAQVVEALDRMARVVESGDDNLSSARRVSILNRLSEARTAAENGEGLPTGPQFYAWGQATSRATRVRASIEGAVAQYAQRVGTTPARAQQEFDRLVSESEAGGRGHDRLRPERRDLNLPVDPHTLHAVAVMEHVASVRGSGAAGGASRRRVPDDMFRPLNSVILDRVGFNPETGDCEVEFQSGYRYRFGNVTEDAVEDMVLSGNPAAVFARMVRNPDFVTDQNDPEPEPVPEPVLVAPAGRARAVRGAASRAGSVAGTVDAVGRCSVCGQFVGDSAGCQNVECGSYRPPTGRAVNPAKVAEQARLLKERQAAYDTLPPQPLRVVGYYVTVNVAVPIFEGAEGTRAELTGFRVAGRLGVVGSDLTRSADCPFRWPDLSVDVPTGELNHRGLPVFAVVKAKETVVGRLDPAKRNGMRLISSVLTCQSCGLSDATTCEHTRMATDAINAVLSHPSSTGRDEALRPVVAAYQDRLRTERAAYLEAHPEAQALIVPVSANPDDHIPETATSVVPTNTYQTNPALDSWATTETGRLAFNGTVATVKQRKEQGLPGIEVDMEPWANASTRGFGSEIEFFLPSANKRAALDAIGRALYEQLPEDTRPVSVWQQYYKRGQADTTRWRFETDQTVDAEIISPIMTDNPETWRQFQIVCDIVKQYGGKVRSGKRTAGGHVHVGVEDYGQNVTNHSNVAAIVTGHEDTMFRMAAAPWLQHRGTKWCNPTANPTGYKTFVNMRTDNSHHINMNWGSVSGTSKDHVEFRLFDSSVDVATLQRQIRVSCAIADTAERAGARNMAFRATREKIGSNATKAAEGPLTGDRWTETTTPLCELADMIAPDDRLKTQMAELFAQGTWTKK